MGQGYRVTRLTADQEARIVELLGDPDVHLITISKRFGVSHQAIREINLKYKIRLPRVTKKKSADP